ncbi:hypothetical protein CRM22_010916 [Opisthorchis felineus]|uniref:non-specific serine/threonine protein kinase n=1 Tax=Opisthorchis felineus TaxID=147828 RepID=A0A4S2KJE6_OPIFE|nr:hypothetical protein CRM22_010916 [Opisthorchis felineus]
MEEFNPEFRSDLVGMLLGSPIPSQPIDRDTVTHTGEEMGRKKESIHKHIIIYVNGDRSSVGTYLLLDCSRYHELEDFLRDLTYALPKHIYLPCGVQRIFTPTGRHRVRSLSDLKDGLSYVCTGFEPLKHLNYGVKGSRMIESESPNRRKPHASRISSNLPTQSKGGGFLCRNFHPHPVNENFRTKRSFNPRLLCRKQEDRLIPQSESHVLSNDVCSDNAFQADSTSVNVLSNRLQLLLNSRQNRGAKNILVVRPNNEGSGLTALPVTLSRLAVQTLGQVMCEISSAFGPRWYNDPVRYLYHLNGREVRSLSDLFQRDSKVFIGTGVQRIFCQVSGTNSLPIRGETVRAILQRFWPDHPNPGGVVQQWEQRVARFQNVRRKGVEEIVKSNFISLPCKADPPLGELLKTVTYAKNEHTIKLSETTGGRPPGHVAGEGQRDSGFVDAGATPEGDDLVTFPRIKHGEERFPQMMDRMLGDDIRTGQPPFLENKERRSKGRNTDFLLSSKYAASVPLQGSEKFRPICAHSTSPAARRRNLPSLRTNEMGVRISSTSQVAFRAINLDSHSPAFQGIKNSTERNTPSCLSGQQASNNLQHSATPIRPIIDRVFRHERSRPSLRTSPHPSSELSAQTGEKPFLQGIKRRSWFNGKKTLGNLSSEELRTSKKDHEIDEKLNNALMSAENVQENTEGICIHQPHTEKVSGSNHIGNVDGTHEGPKGRASSVCAITEKPVVKIYHEDVLANQQDAVGTGSTELHTNNLAKGDTVPDIYESHLVIHKSVDMVEESGTTYKKGKFKDKNTKIAHDASKPTEPKTQQSPQKAAHSPVKLVGLEHLNLKFVPDSENLRSRYHIGRILGDGNFAVVRLVRRRDTGQKYATKIIDKAKLRGKEMMLHQEITILHSCSHPNIVRLLEEYETPKEIWLVMELVKDGDLFEGITNSVKYSEKVASGIVADIANALFYLHCRYIVHRDLKPENVLMWHQPDGKLRVKLADFGLAVEVRRNLYTVCGTPTYIAPEILSERGYGLEVDLWALGIITYIMLCGFAPFRSPDRRQSQLFESIKRGVFVFLSPYWDEISQGAKDLVNRLLVVTPRKRLTAIETLTHPWVYFEGCSDNPGRSSKLEKSREEYKKELENEAQNIKSRKL